MTLRQPAQKRSYLLMVGGLTVRYFSGVRPLVAAVEGVPTPPGDTYTDVEAIVDVSSQSSGYSPARGIVEESGVTVTLASRGDYDDPHDPARQLLRVGWRGASRRAALIETLSHNINLEDAVIDRDPSAWDLPGYIHVGQEAMHVTAIAGIGTVADPWRFTLPTRNVAGSKPQRHAADTTQSRTPIVTQEAVSWRGRPAVLYVTYTPDNPESSPSLNDYIEVVRGYIESTPALAEDGLSVELTIVPWSTLLDQSIGGQLAHDQVAKTKLLRGCHAFDGENASVVEHQQLWRQGVAWTARGDADATINGSAFVLLQDANDVTAYDEVFDPSLGGDHPRMGRIDVGHDDDNAGIVVTGTDIPGKKLIVGGAQPTDNIAAGEPVRNSRIYEIVQHTVAGAEAIQRWPRDALEAINSEAGWAPVTHLGADGQWASVEVFAGGGEAPARLDVRHLVFPRGDGSIEIRFDADPLFMGGLSPTQKLWYPFDFRVAGSEGAWVNTWEDPAAPGARQGYDRRVPVHYDEGRIVHTPEQFGHRHRQAKIDIGGIAEAFYQRGERFILLEESIVSTSGSIRVTIPGDEEKQVIFRVLGSDTALDPDTGTPVGIRYEVHPVDRVRTLPSFGVWANSDEEPEFEPVAAFDNLLPTTIMLQLLMSGAGELTNGGYDVLPFGYNLDSDDLDVNSFEAYPIPPNIDRWTFAITKSELGADLIGAMAIALGATLTSRLDPNTGKRKLALVPAGLPQRHEAILSLTPDDLVATPVVTSVDDEVWNVYRFTINHDPITGEAGKPEIVFRDVPSVDEHGGEARELALELRGIRIEGTYPAEAQRLLGPIFNNLAAVYGQARRVVRFRVGMYLGHRLYPGAVVLMTHPSVRGPNGKRGITDEPLRVTRVTSENWREGCEVEAVMFGAPGTGWNASARVSAVVSPTVIEVEDNAYTFSSVPVIEGDNLDVGYFEVGDAVLCIPRGDYASRVFTTVLSVDVATRQIEFNDPHGLSIGDTIRPDDWTVASDHHKTYAYLADEDELLDAGGAAEQEAFTIT